MKFILFAFVTFSTTLGFSFELKNQELNKLYNLLNQVTTKIECSSLTAQHLPGGEIFQLFPNYHVSDLDSFTFNKPRTSIETEFVKFFKTLEEYGYNYDLFDDARDYDNFKLTLLNMALKLDLANGAIALFTLSVDGRFFTEEGIILYDDYTGEVVLWTIGTCE
jgi:hypothetical protein